MQNFSSPPISSPPNDYYSDEISYLEGYAEELSRELGDLKEKIKFIKTQTSNSNDPFEKTRIENLIDHKLKFLRRAVFFKNLLGFSALILTALLSITVSYVLKMNSGNIEYKIDLSVALSVLATLTSLLYLTFYLKKDDKTPLWILFVTIFSIIVIFVLKLDEKTLSLSGKIDLSAGLAVSGTLVSLICIYVVKDKMIVSQEIQSKINDLEKLQINFMNCNVEAARDEYLKITKINE